MDRSETLRVLYEATRLAKVANTSAAAGAGVPAASTGLNGGAVIAGTYTRYGRVGITPIVDGFLPRPD